nr:hypothetical protein [uncultured Flavobacterium sp.]
MAPSLNAEGRYYYNLEKREAKGLNMKNNSGNFVSLKAQYYGNFATITSVEKSLIRNQFTIAPMWNFSRNFGKSNFGFEWGIGAGYSVSFQKDYSNSKFFIPLDFTFSYKL